MYSCIVKQLILQCYKEKLVLTVFLAISSFCCILLAGYKEVSYYSDYVLQLDTFVTMHIPSQGCFLNQQPQS